MLQRARESRRHNACLTDQAFTDYVEGESLAAGDPFAAEAAYRAAVDAAQQSGARFVEGVATVGLASV